MPDSDDLFVSYMELRSQDGIPESLAHKLGIFDTHIILRCYTTKQIDSAIAICARWAGKRAHRWAAIPPRDDRDVLREYGYVGCILDDSIKTPVHVEQVRQWMLAYK